MPIGKSSSTSSWYNSALFGERDHVSHHGRRVSGGGLGEIEESLYVEVSHEQVASEAAIVRAEDDGGYRSDSIHQCVQSNYQ